MRDEDKSRPQLIEELKQLRRQLAGRETSTRDQMKPQESLKKDEEYFNLLFEMTQDLILIHGFSAEGMPGNFIRLNTRACELLEYSYEELSQLTPMDIITDVDVMKAPAEISVLERERTVIFENTLVSKSGRQIPVEICSQIFEWNGEKTAISIVRNTTNRKLAEEKLLERETRFRMIFETLSEGVALNENVYNERGEMVDYRIVEVNSAFRHVARLYGEVVGKRATELYGLSSDSITAFWLKHKILNTVQYTEITSPNGIDMFLVATSPFVNDRFVTSFFEITDRKQREEQLRAALHEREVLLRELYHRTKNNMQVIRSMLVLQAAVLPENKDLMQLVRSTENRILSMSLVHQMLYQSQDLSRISLQEYVEELGRLLMQDCGTASRDISLIVKITPEKVLLDTATPCGLVLNELFSNALQHAFPGKQKGEISITLFRNTADSIKMVFSDNGVGVPKDFDFRAQESLGLQMVYEIVEQQMKGDVQFTCNNGVICTIEFPDSLHAERI